MAVNTLTPGNEEHLQDSADGRMQLSPEAVELIWSLPDQVLSDVQLTQRIALRQWLSRKADSPLAAYLTGRPADLIEPLHIRELTDDTLARFRPQDKAVAALQLLGKIIDAGNEQEIFSLCPPPVPVLIPRQTSPFEAGRFPNLDVAPALRKTLSASLVSPRLLARARMPPGQIAQFAMGQVLLSTIVHGGLVHADLLDALVNRMVSDHRVLDCLGNRAFVEFSLNWRRQTDAEFRRWFPDDLSAALLMRLEIDTVKTAFKVPDQNVSASFRKDIWRCIKTFLRHTLGKGVPLPRSLPGLLDAVRLDLETRMPIMLVHYAARSFVSHSLKPDVWRRLHGHPVDSSAALSASASGKDSPPGIGLTRDVFETDEVEPRWLRSIREALRGNDRAAMAGRIDSLLDTPPPASNKAARDIFLPATHAGSC